ncbi:MAG: protein jag [Clostridiaceae bacterium]|nr:protein jag [Clostridiaceae bacterium]
MKSIEVIGKTVDEALNKALAQLNVTKDNVMIDIIDEGSKGLFNLIGVRPAKINVTVKKSAIDDAKNFLNDILNNMNITADISIIEKDNTLNIDITGKNVGSIIGYRGETLDSIQYLVSIIVNKNHEEPYRKVIVDVENYRKKREDTLKGVAVKAANRVRKSGRAYKLEPMNPYERRIIHSALQEFNDITTHSEGEDPHRRVIIELKKNF